MKKPPTFSEHIHKYLMEQKITKLKELEQKQKTKRRKKMTLINITPHALNMQDVEGNNYVLPSSGIVISAKPVAKKIKTIKSIELFDTRFIPNGQGLKDLAKLKQEFPNGIFIGSMIAADAYPEVFSVIAVEGTPRTERLVYDWKFNIGRE